ncbi:MAG: hypothetical protein LBT23_06845 [Synergistaceae bacterium]|nr:hypothetical protein [Synergistaceae bacterium]
MKIASGIIASMSGEYMSNFTTKVSKSAVRLMNGLKPRDTRENSAAAVANSLAAGSRITDVESAREIIASTKLNILVRAANSVSGQANQSQKNIISLIQ